MPTDEIPILLTQAPGIPRLPGKLHLGGGGCGGRWCVMELGEHEDVKEKGQAVRGLRGLEHLLLIPSQGLSPTTQLWASLLPTVGLGAARELKTQTTEPDSWIQIPVPP